MNEYEWATLLAALGPALAKALYEVGKEVVAKPLMEPAAERFKAWVRRDHDARVDDAKVREAVEVAVEAVGLTEWEVADYPLRGALDRLAGEGHDALRKQTVAAALAMIEDAPGQVPDELLQVLKVPGNLRSDLAHFLWAFRGALAEADEDYRALIQLSGEDEVRKLLRALMTGEAVVAVRIASKEDREIEARYLKAVVSECSTLPLGGRDYRGSTPAGFVMPLEKVYIALNTTERPPEARGPKSDFGEATRALEMENLSALRVFLDCSCLVLLGEPGSGKTTFADHLALCLAGERLQPGVGWAEHLRTHDAAWGGSAPFPIRLRLRHFAADTECLPADSDERGRAEHLLAYIERRLRDGRYGADLPDHALDCLDRRGDALLILDGLDEVGDPARREQVAHAIADLAQYRCPRARLLVTCRVRQYLLDSDGRPTAAWALPGFRVATLADFDGTQIDAFIEAWFDQLHELDRFSEGERKWKINTLKEAIGLRPDLQHIAPRPILLTQMALVHDFEGELPGTRVQLYDKCAELLLWKWEQLRAKQAGQQLTAESFIREQMGVPGLKKEDLQRALDHAVYDAHADQGASDGADEGPADIPVETLRQRFGECLKRADRSMPNHEAIGKAHFFIDEYLRGRNGLIVPAGEHTFQTPHRTFQEFLAARWLQLMDRDFDREAPRLVRENYDLWREVFLLAVGQARLGAAVDALYHLCPAEWPQDEKVWQRLILAGQGLDEIGLPKVRSDEYRGLELEKRVIHLLRRTMQDLAPDGRPNDPPRVPVPTRYAAGEVLDRLGWLPPDINAWVEVEIPRSKSQSPSRIYVGRYPVTNRQFARFVAAGGYEERGKRWWSTEGCEWRKRGKRLWSDRGTDQPEYWDEPRFGKSRRGYPVVGVSWYEAMAYCTWLTEQLQGSVFPFQVWRDGELETLDLEPETLAARLPTEEEWVAMAGGLDDRERYPWDPPEGSATQGEGAILARANVREAGLGGISPVAMYLSGRSPDGVWDLGGNVWEWTASWYAEERRYRALRGGSWGDGQGSARVRERCGYNPGLSYHFIGLRVVASPAGSGCWMREPKTINLTR